MSATSETPAPQLSPAQAIELCLLVDLEARWQNLRATRQPASGTKPVVPENLHDKQTAYEAFRKHLAAYSQKYVPAYVPELLLNNPARLGAWCGRMQDLYLRVGQDPRISCPVHLVEKACRCAEGMAARLGKGPFSRSTPLADTQAAVRELEALARWCEGLNPIAA